MLLLQGSFAKEILDMNQVKILFRSTRLRRVMKKNLIGQCV